MHRSKGVHHISENEPKTTQSDATNSYTPPHQILQPVFHPTAGQNNRSSLRDSKEAQGEVSTSKKPTLELSYFWHIHSCRRL